MSILKVVSVSVLLFMAAFSLPAYSDSDGYNWRAYNTASGGSPGGWLSYRSDAESRACNLKESNKNIRVEIQRRKVDDNLDNYQVIVRNYSC